MNVVKAGYNARVSVPGSVVIEPSAGIWPWALKASIVPYGGQYRGTIFVRVDGGYPKPIGRAFGALRKWDMSGPGPYRLDFELGDGEPVEVNVTVR